GCEKIRTRGSADYAFLDLHLWLNGNMSLERAHATSHVVKDRLMTKFPQLVDVVIHIEPPPISRQKAVSRRKLLRLPHTAYRLLLVLLRSIRLARHLTVGNGADGDADLGLFVALDRRLLLAAVLLAPPEG